MKEWRDTEPQGLRFKLLARSENRRLKAYAGSSPVPSAIPQWFPFHFDKMLWQ